MGLFRRSAPASIDPFPGVEGPAELQQMSGRWMANAFASEGFEWRKSGELVRQLGTRKEFITWFGSKYNRRDQGSMFDLCAVIFDSGLKRWRATRPDRVLANTNFVANQANLHHYLLLDEPSDRQRALDEASDWIRSTPLPFFEVMRDPGRIISEAPPQVAPGPIVEWLLWQDRRDDVPAFLSHVLATCNEDFLARVARGHQWSRDGHPAGGETNSDRALALGWLLDRNGLTP